MVKGVIVGGHYQHYKGMNYIVKEVARHSETLGWFVVYECQYDNPSGKIWVRPLDMFLDIVDVDGGPVPRFKYMGKSS